MTNKEYIISDSEKYRSDLIKITEIENRTGNKYTLMVGINEKLAIAWANIISTDPEVIKWTAEARKRSTSTDILQRNKPSETKNIATYSLWSENKNLAAVSWYQIWEPGKEEQGLIEKFCGENNINKPYIITSAFRIVADYRRQGLAGKIITNTETHYKSYLLAKFKSNDNILFTLETDENNIPAVQTYLKNGYKTIGTFDQPEKESFHGKRLLMAKY